MATTTIIGGGAAPIPVAKGGTASTTVVGAYDTLTAQSTVITAAATTDIGAADGIYVRITGSATITALGTAPAGALRFCRFVTGSCTLTHNATSLILPGQANIAMGSTDTMLMGSLGSGNWACLTYQHTDIAPLNGGTNVVTVSSANTLSTSRTINGVAFNGSANITVTAAGSTLSDTVPVTKGGTGGTTIDGAAAGLQGLTRLASTSLNLNSTSSQTMYTTPTGKSFIPVYLFFRNPSVDLTTTIASGNAGFNANADDVMTGIGGSIFQDLAASTTLSTYIVPNTGISGTLAAIGTSTQTLKIKLTIAHGSAATCTVDVLGYIF